MMERIRRFLIPGERVLLEDLGNLLDMGQESLELLVQIFQEGPPEASLLSSRTSKITDLEKKGDVIVTKIEKDVATGAISPSLIDDFLRLSERIDGILDIAHSISREVNRVQKYRKDKPNLIEKRIYSEIPSLVELGVSAVQELQKIIIVATTNSRSLSNYADKIETLEEQADDLKDAMLDEIFASADQLPYYIYEHLVRLTIQVDDLLDRCEDASDLITIVVGALGL